MRSLRALFIFCIAINTSFAAAEKSPPTRVFCPAVSQDDYDERYADVPRSILPVAMIAVGTLNRETMQLKIQRTLLGP